MSKDCEPEDTECANCCAIQLALDMQMMKYNKILSIAKGLTSSLDELSKVTKLSPMETIIAVTLNIIAEGRL